MTTISEAEKMVCRKLRKNEETIVKVFGTNPKFDINIDSRGGICANKKPEFRSNEKKL